MIVMIPTVTEQSVFPQARIWTAEHLDKHESAKKLHYMRQVSIV